MQPAEYANMYAAEQAHWWYRGLRLFLAAELASVGFPGRRGTVLDAGCGTGGNLAWLGELGYRRLVGCDAAAEAVAYCRQRGLAEVSRGDVNRLPYPDGAFDLVLCVDVLECAGAEPETALRELGRVLKPGGYLLLVVAAFDFLRSEHDRAVDCVRRFTQPQLRELLTTLPATVVHLRYRFGWLFPAIAVHRLWRRFFRRAQTLPRSDVSTPPRWLNEILLQVVRGELALSRFLPSPFGTSLVALVRKRPPAV